MKTSLYQLDHKWFKPHHPPLIDRSLFRHRQALCKELFMIQPSDDLESSFMDFLKNGDTAVLDTMKWSAHGDSDKLRYMCLSLVNYIE